MALLVWRSDWLKLGDVESFDIAEVSRDVIRLEFQTVNQSKGEIVLQRIPE
jgi:hypothetical protein